MFTKIKNLILAFIMSEEESYNFGPNKSTFIVIVDGKAELVDR